MTDVKEISFFSFENHFIEKSVFLENNLTPIICGIHLPLNRLHIIVKCFTKMQMSRQFFVFK